MNNQSLVNLRTRSAKNRKSGDNSRKRRRNGGQRLKRRHRSSIRTLGINPFNLEGRKAFHTILLQLLTVMLHLLLVSNVSHQDERKMFLVKVTITRVFSKGFNTSWNFSHTSRYSHLDKKTKSDHWSVLDSLKVMHRNVSGLNYTGSHPLYLLSKIVVIVNLIEIVSPQNSCSKYIKRFCILGVFGCMGLI